MKKVQIAIIFKTLAAALAAAVFFAGCAKPPTEEMNNAVEMVTRAENDIDAVTYGGGSLARARDALARMRAEASSKRYESAKSSAAEASAAALRAIDEGRAGVSRARDEAASLVLELKPLITETEQGINAARAAGLPLDFGSVDRDFENACTEAENAQTSLDAGRFRESVDQSRAARSGLVAINQGLSGTATAVSRKK